MLFLYLFRQVKWENKVPFDCILLR